MYETSPYREELKTEYNGRAEQEALYDEQELLMCLTTVQACANKLINEIYQDRRIEVHGLGKSPTTVLFLDIFVNWAYTNMERHKPILLCVPLEWY